MTAQPVSVPVRAGDLLAAQLRWSTSMFSCHMEVWQRAAPGPGFGSLNSLDPTTPQSFFPVPNKELAYNATVALAAPAVTAIAPATRRRGRRPGGGDRRRARLSPSRPGCRSAASRRR